MAGVAHGDEDGVVQDGAGDGDGAVLAGGVDGVVEQFGQGAFGLRGVAENARVGREVGDGDGRFGEAGEEGVDGDRREIIHGAAGEGEQALREGGGAVGGIAGPFEIGVEAGDAGAGGAALHEFEVAEHAGEEIIEVMRHLRREGGEFVGGLRFVRRQVGRQRAH